MTKTNKGHRRSMQLHFGAYALAATLAACVVSADDHTTAIAGASLVHSADTDADVRIGLFEYLGYSGPVATVFQQGDNGAYCYDGAEVLPSSGTCPNGHDVVHTADTNRDHRVTLFEYLAYAGPVADVFQRGKDGQYHWDGETLTAVCNACTAGNVETRECGTCGGGSSSRTCDVGGCWSEWSDCEGAPTCCDDGVQNGDELGVDCGGSCDELCAPIGASCTSAAHCAPDGVCRDAPNTLFFIGRCEDPADRPLVSYAETIRPIIQSACNRCHSFDLEYDVFVAWVVPGNPAASGLVQVAIFGSMQAYLSDAADVGFDPTRDTEKSLVQDWIVSGAAP